MWFLINSCSNHHNCVCGHEKTNTVSLFLYITQLACRQCSVAMRICTTLASKLCLAYVPAPSTYDLQVGFMCVFFSPISEISHQLLSPAMKVLSDRDVLKPLWLLVPSIRMAGCHKEKPKPKAPGASRSLHWHSFAKCSGWVGTCRLSTSPCPERCCWGLMEENWVERVNTELEKTGSVVIVQGEEWEIKWYLFRSLPYCSLHCSLGIFILSTRKSASTSWKTQMKLLP